MPRSRLAGTLTDLTTRPARIRRGRRPCLPSTGSRRLSRRGFTIMEMIVATFLLAIAVTGALAAFATATRATGAAEHIQTAALLGQRRLTELELQSSSLGGGEQSGDFGEEYPGYRWQTSVEPTDYQNLVKVTVTVSWGEPPSVNQRNFTTYLRTDTQQQQQNEQQDQQNQQNGQAGANGGGGAGNGG